MSLNQRAWLLCEKLAAEAEELRISVSRTGAGVRLLDCGIAAAGGLEAGRRLAEVCLAGLGRVRFVPGDREHFCGPAVAVASDHPLAACMASQYAGWQIKGDGFFAMGSGPMRAAAGKEELFQQIGCRESPSRAVGILETRQVPPDAVCLDLARQCRVAPAELILCLAPTASLAGTVQVVARSLETALHKLLTLGFDLRQVESGFGMAPLAPVAADDLAAIGRTNDAILYGGEVTLWLRADDNWLAKHGPQVPSSSSADHGRPFAHIFERYNHDFYRIDPHLFSPAVVNFVNLSSGRTHRFGHTLPRVLHESFS